MRLKVGSSLVDSLAREVARGGKPVAVEPKVFDLLLYLIDNRHRVVSRDEIVDRIWSGRAISDDALSSCIKAARRALDDDGSAQSVIRTFHRRGFRLVGPVVEEPAAVGIPAAVDPGLQHELSIAVLPFQNMSGDPEREYFSDGLVEDIITALSRFRALRIVSRNSSFAYKGRTFDVRQVGRELGVRYILEGSVRAAGGRLRITGQLIETASGVHIWADRYEGAADDVFALQDQVTLNVVGAITPRLTQVEIERTTRKPTDHLGAYDCYLRGLQAYHSAGADGLLKARDLFGQAIALDPNFALPYAVSAFSEALLRGIGAGSGPVEGARAVTLARRAVELDRDDAHILAMATWVESHMARDMDAAAELAERAIAVNPNLAFAWAASGWVHIWVGKPQVALEHFKRARSLSPLDVDQRFVLTGLSHAHFMSGEYGEALALAVKTLQVWRQAPAYRIAAAAAALAGHADEARAFVRGLLQVDPARRISNLGDSLGAYCRREDVDHLMTGLRLGGLPE